MSAVAAAGPLLAACGPTAGQARGASSSATGVLPVPTSGVVPLIFQPNVQFIPWSPSTQRIYQQFVDENFNTNPKYKGIWASIFPGGWGNATGQIAASIAGSGYADVVMMCCGDVPTMELSGIAAPLDPLLKQDNIPRSLWSSGHLLADSRSGTLYGLPSYDGTLAIFYRQDILDQLGLAYPDSSWTYKDAATIWTACTGKNQGGTHRAGASFYWNSGVLPFWLKGWGASYMNAAQDQATMNSPEGAAALTYVTDLLKAGAAIDGEQNTTLLTSQRAVFAMYHSAHVVDVGARILGNTVKWNILPVPVWPAGRSTFVTIDCYMLNARTKHLQEAWTLLKWISGAEGDLAWPKFQIQISLVTPSLVSMWDYWETTVVQVAPPLVGKDLKWFYDAAQKGYDYPTLYFSYAPLQADNVVNTWMGRMNSGTVSPPLGLAQMQAQVNSIEAAGKTVQASASAVAGLFPSKGPQIAVVPRGL